MDSNAFNNEKEAPNDHMASLQNHGQLRKPLSDLSSSQSSSVPHPDAVSSPLSSLNASQNALPSLRRPKSGEPIDDLTHQTHLINLNQSQESPQSSQGSDAQKYNGVNYLGAGDTSNTHKWTASSGSESISELNPNAQEFVPRFKAAVVYPNPVEKYNNSVHGQYSNGYWYADGGDSIPSHGNRDSEDFVALGFLREFIDEIAVKPNKYESNIGYLTDVMNNWLDEDDVVMQSAVNVIVDQAITDTQFRYNGVRLCIHFMNTLTSVSPNETFAILLFQRCQRELSRRDALVSSSNGESYLRGLTLFIGDLYSRCSATELAECLPPLLDTLMANASTENLKCVCQVLKLCGSTMENFYRGKGSDNTMALIMEKLNSFSNNSEVNAHIRDLITTVVGMQKRGWTSAVPMASSATVNPYLNKNFSDQSGNTSGDCFEEYNSYSDDDDLHTSYDFGACGDEDDDEVCSAFDEFLKNSGQN